MYARFVYCVVAAILFFLISSPWLYTFVNSILGKVFTVAVKGCPTIPGLFLHGFVFLVVIYALSYFKVIREAFIGEDISLSIKLACDPRCKLDETCTPNGCMPRMGQTTGKPGIVYVNGVPQPYKGENPGTNQPKINDLRLGDYWSSDNPNVLYVNGVPQPLPVKPTVVAAPPAAIPVTKPMVIKQPAVLTK